MADDLLAKLRPEPGRYHEVFAADGEVHPHWQAFSDALRELGPAQMQHRAGLVDRQVRENGVTYNIYGDSQGPDRAWRVGAVPNLIPVEEWQRIASGVAQRAQLLDRILADLYGEQQLLRQGLMPQELVFGHNNFLAPCVGLQPVGGTFLHTYAVDLARAGDGRWWVMADRTQAPSGAGYALENRQVVARAFPTQFRQLGVQSLTGYFQTLLQTLRRQAPTSAGEPPLIVLLTPGRYNETYFEHVYLARHLGIPLVEGHDLSVRQPHVFLKTLNGLKRVHAILRRLDDDFCDPLELRSDSALGIPGLLAVARAGNVLIANALGTGVLESPGLLGFLPSACRHLLGETLELPSVATWWCGEPPAMEEALERLQELVIKPAFPSQHFEPVFGRNLDEDGLEKLRERIRQRPYAYLAQERMQLAQSPVWHNDEGRFINHAVGMRAYAVAGEHGYVVMPGGLARVAANPHDDVVSMQRGGTSKDTWVCFGDRQRQNLPRSRHIGVRDLRRHDPYLPSRMAENMFWLGRYAERADNQARLIRAALSRHLDSDPAQALALMLSLHHGQALGLFADHGELTPRLLAGIRNDDERPDLRGNLRALAYAAAEVRSRLSQENWSAIAALEQEVHDIDADSLEPVTALGFLDRLLMSLSSLAGFAHDEMTQDQSWRFLMLGRLLERLQYLCGLLATALQTPGMHEPAGLDWLLEMADSRITYRSRYLSQAQLIPVLDLLLLDPGNPHAVSFQLRQIMTMLDTLDSRDRRPLAQLHAQLETLDLGVIESDMAQPERLVRSLQTLARLLEQISLTAWQLGDGISLQYFAHVERQSQALASS
ncbi:circularly permuted type 2 ATP-grasp protein [Amnimonas aquatica]|uniref:Molybdopterin oxidoreductase n=1 Tax=Amnimonas aquatica TaxID=2094561 RepID=A0A2P6AT99_9GAMM|nr:circularly permuted type 2 ATP-grasp protein [Amnimonas aquatica]PQA46577.1 molybdopterin oxidoreductase [Amnimonas aquatica]